jgi:hypothetical protein
MPLVILKYRLNELENVVEKILVKNIRQIVANALECDDPGGKLVPADVEIEIVRHSRSTMIGLSDLVVEIQAHDFPSRRQTFESRQHRIRLDVMQILETNLRPEQPCYLGVWLKLFPGSWSEGEVRGVPR